MITKAAFVKAINSIQEYLKYLDEVEKVCKVSFSDVPLGEMEDSLITVLAYGFNSDNSKVIEWIKDEIEWFCFEDDFGNYKLRIYLNKGSGNEEEIILTNADELYEFIVREYAMRE